MCVHGLALYSGGRDRCRSGYAADFGFTPPASSPFLPPRSLPRTGPLLRSGSRACFRACPRAGSCPSPRIVPISPPQSLPRTGPRLRSRSRACFRVYPRAGLCIGPSLVFASVPVSAPVPAPVFVSAPRWSLSQSQSSFQPPLPFPLLYPCLPLCLLRAGLCPNPGLGPRLCLGPAPLLSLLLFVPFVPASGYPKSLAAVFLLFFLDFSVFRSSPFLPCLLLLSLCQGWNSCISKFLVVHLRKI